MLYIGIDPGAAWCGFAALDATTYRVEARTYSVKAHGGYLCMVRDLLDLLPHNRPTTIIAEDFRIRRSGHQRFDPGHTLRFLGALEFGCSQIDAFEFYTVPPNDNGERETRELYGVILQRYRRHWPRPRHAAWGHCLSAWRVLGRHLMRYDHGMLMHLHQHQGSHRSSQWLPSLQKHGDHCAPAATWIAR
jgi:hypothetical protein